MKLTAMMLVRNEENRYLKRVLDHLDKYVDEMVIVDDCSTDSTPDICESYEKARVIRLREHGFDNEWKLRQFCWEETAKTDPDWILAIDADEIFEDKMISEIKTLMENPFVDAWAFRLFDFWGSEEYYRDDHLWCAHNFYGIFLLRNLDKEYQWRQTPVHCGRIPMNIWSTHRVANSDIRLKHYGWANKDEHIRKYERYMASDGDGRYGSLPQYESILDENPNLKKWEE